MLQYNVHVSCHGKKIYFYLYPRQTFLRILCFTTKMRNKCAGKFRRGCSKYTLSRLYTWDTCIVRIFGDLAYYHNLSALRIYQEFPTQETIIIDLEFFLEFFKNKSAILNRGVGRSENPGVPISFGGHNLPPLSPGWDRVKWFAKIWGWHGTSGIPRDKYYPFYFKEFLQH